MEKQIFPIPVLYRMREAGGILKKAEFLSRKRMLSKAL